MRVDPATGYEILASGSITDVARAFKPHGVTVRPADVPEMTAGDSDAYECGRYARRLARQMVNAAVESRFYRIRGRGHLALMARVEAAGAREIFHRLIRNWRDVPGFRKGYRAEGGGAS